MIEKANNMGEILFWEVVDHLRSKYWRKYGFTNDGHAYKVARRYVRLCLKPLYE